MNSIITRQNRDENITRLIAQRQLYDEVGLINNIYAVIAVFIPLLFAIVQEIFNNFEWIGIVARCYSIVVFILSFMISSAEKKKKELAACIQQEFDVDVYQMPWDEKLFGQRRKISDVIVEASERAPASRIDRKKLQNWYTSAIESLSQKEAIEACQKENCIWDIKLRERYKTMLYIILSLVIIIPTILCLAKEQLVRELLMAYIVALPVIKWLICTICDLDGDIKRMMHIKELLYSMNKKEEDQLLYIQKCIYQNRRMSVKVPNWFYKLYRDKDEIIAARIVEFDKHN